MKVEWDVPGFAGAYRRAKNVKSVHMSAQKPRLPARLIPEGMKPKDYIKLLKRIARDESGRIKW
jgi:hypothetical protein